MILKGLWIAKWNCDVRAGHEGTGRSAIELKTQGLEEIALGEDVLLTG